MSHMQTQETFALLTFTTAKVTSGNQGYASRLAAELSSFSATAHTVGKVGRQPRGLVLFDAIKIGRVDLHAYRVVVITCV